MAAVAGLTGGAAACGTSEPVATGTSAVVAPSSAGPTTDATATASSDDPDGTAASTPTENVFADVDVLDVYTGQALNLEAELAGGATPVLLWFWAPH